MPPHHYCITVDALEPTTGEGGLESISFFASTSHDILTTVNSLRARLDCSACHATKLAVGLGLIHEVMHAHRDPAPLHEFVRGFPESFQADAKKINA